MPTRESNGGNPVIIWVFAILYAVQTTLSILGNLWVLQTLFRQFLLDEFPRLRKLPSLRVKISHKSPNDVPEQSPVDTEPVIKFRNGGGRPERVVIQPHLPKPGGAITKRFKPGFLHLAALSLTDICSAVSISFFAVELTAGDFPWTLQICRLMFALLGLHRILSPLLLFAMALDRYFAVCKPEAPDYRQHAWAIRIIGACAGFATMLITPQIVFSKLGSASTADNDSSTNDICVTRYNPAWLSRAAFMIQFILAYACPLALIVTCYGSVINRLWKHTSRFNSQIPLRKIVCSSAILIVFHFLCWSPYWVTEFVYRFKDSVSTKEAGFIWSHATNQASFQSQYAYMNKQLRSSPDRLGSLPNYLLAKIYRDLSHDRQSTSQRGRSRQQQQQQQRQAAKRLRHRQKQTLAAAAAMIVDENITHDQRSLSSHALQNAVLSPIISVPDELDNTLTSRGSVLNVSEADAYSDDAQMNNREQVSEFLLPANNSDEHFLFPAEGSGSGSGFTDYNRRRCSAPFILSPVRPQQPELDSPCSSGGRDRGGQIA